MEKGKFSFSIGKSKEKESESLGNIFDEKEVISGKNRGNIEDFDQTNSDNFQSISANFEYNKSINFYNEHPELLEDFDKPNEIKGREIEKEQEKKEEPKKVSLGKSKYLSKIQKYVELRNIEREEIQEEKIQKEIQEEENTQVFITDSYKDILEERKKFKDSFIKRKLSEGENLKISGPSSIFEMRFSPVMDKIKDEESNQQVAFDDSKEELMIKDSSSADNLTIEDNNIVNNEEVSKASKDFKQVKIQQARERYLLRKQAREST
ncbi:uncharacterized protein cubi_03308 [Cryptosporidium ubiquitum]|uniref:Nuclear speckle splicing regulatory protein 1 N-terminal domain-containing protein n=1 Tax=Cryptosporidium ubiquitum TaxID=857276 RepID=A0A1J4MHS8_9CRYT|nr:uncharacterized protein cubi_03308 [Cryptosporidium ubiquitum]OII72572.1 hypothetical protein cubi_03308 [Cryptosporidium ubiquitum]